MNLPIIMKRTLPMICAVSLCIPLAADASEPAAVLEQASLNAGGGTSEGGGIVLQATLGQPVAGVANVGDTTLESGFWHGRLQVVVIYDNAFEEWMGNLPPGEQPPVGQRGKGDTPAGDGVSNLLKFAFGLMPLTPAADAMPDFIVDEGDFIGLTFTRSADADVTLTLLGSEDLENWTEVPFNETVVEPGLPGNRVKVDLLTGIEKEDADRYFLRLEVTTN